MKKYSAKSISDLIVYEICSNRGFSLSVSKLMHLLYYADILSMVGDGKYLFKDNFQAGIFCPMHRNVLESFSELKTVHDVLTERDIPSDFDLEKYDSEIIDHVNLVIDKFMNWPSDALTLRMRTEYPWILAREGYDNNEKCEIHIDKRVCRIYYIGFDKLINKCNAVYDRTKDK